MFTGPFSLGLPGGGRRGVAKILHLAEPGGAQLQKKAVDNRQRFRDSNRPRAGAGAADGAAEDGRRQIACFAWPTTTTRGTTTTMSTCCNYNKQLSTCRPAGPSYKSDYGAMWQPSTHTQAQEERGRAAARWALTTFGQTTAASFKTQFALINRRKSILTAYDAQWRAHKSCAVFFSPFGPLAHCISSENRARGIATNDKVNLDADLLTEQQQAAELKVKAWTDDNSDGYCRHSSLFVHF